MDLLRPGAAETMAEPVVGKLYLPILPIISYNPANGLILGVGIAPGLLLDSLAHTRVSSGLANIQLTSKKQVNFNVRHNVYLPRDRYILQGDWRLLLFSQPTYGLGISAWPGAFSLNGIPVDDPSSGAQPMNFTYVRLYETLFTHLHGSLYGGLGLAVDAHSSIEDERLDLMAEPPFYTSHYLYSTDQGFSPTRYSANGLAMRLLFDSRDVAVNARKGMYMDAGFRVNTTWLGSTRSSSQLNVEFRHYKQIGQGTNRIAFWLIGQFLTSGNLPYLALPSIGWDTYNRSGRGYVQGRFRGENLAYGEAEYRFRILRNDFIGGVVFLNATSVDNRYVGQALLDRFAFGYGAGLRFKMTKETRTNICVDAGFGQQGSSGIYFGLQEAF